MTEPTTFPMRMAAFRSRHNLTPRALRFYEEKGLLAPERDGPHRLYDEHCEARVLVVKAYRAAGISVSVIAEKMKQDPSRAWLTSSEKADLVQDHLRERQDIDAALVATTMLDVVEEGNSQ